MARALTVLGFLRIKIWTVPESNLGDKRKLLR